MQNHHLTNLAAFVALMSTAGIAEAATTCPAPQPLTNMTQTLNSDFTGGQFDSTHWHPFAAPLGTINNEQQAYVPSALTVNRGTGLRITTNKGTTQGMAYSSGEMSTLGLFSQTYGHFEMSARLPQANGLWPAFWMINENGIASAEIDILEYIYATNGVLPTTSKNTSFAYTTNHYIGANKAMAYQMGQLGTSSTWTNTFHTYAIDWRPGSINYLIDGASVFCVSEDTANVQKIPNTPMFMIVNNAIGPNGSWSGSVQANQVFPQYMDVAYVRAYQFKDVAPAPATPIDMVGTTLSQTQVTLAQIKAGQVIKFTSTVKIAGKAAGNINPQYVLRSFDGKTNLVTASTLLTNTVANKDYPVTVSMTLPKTMTTGYYPVSSWTPTTNLGNYYQQQIAMIQVVP